MKYCFFWINLESCVRRRNNTELLFKEKGWDNVRIEGILNEDREMGCILSHIKACKTFLESDYDIGFICEDDITLEYEKYWKRNLEEVVRDAPEDWEIIQLSLTVNFPKLEEIKSYPLDYVPHNNYASAVCYVINKSGADNIAKLIPSDYNIYQSDNLIYRRVETYTYKYPMFTYPMDNDSNIHPSDLPAQQNDKTLIDKYLEESFKL